MNRSIDGILKPKTVFDGIQIWSDAISAKALTMPHMPRKRIEVMCIHRAETPGDLGMVSQCGHKFIAVVYAPDGSGSWRQCFKAMIENKRAGKE